MWWPWNSCQRCLIVHHDHSDGQLSVCLCVIPESLTGAPPAVTFAVLFHLSPLHFLLLPCLHPFIITFLLSCSHHLTWTRPRLCPYMRMLGCSLSYSVPILSWAVLNSLLVPQDSWPALISGHSVCWSIKGDKCFFWQSYSYCGSFQTCLLPLAHLSGVGKPGKPGRGGMREGGGQIVTEQPFHVYWTCRTLLLLYSCHPASMSISCLFATRTSCLSSFFLTATISWGSSVLWVSTNFNPT